MFHGHIRELVLCAIGNGWTWADQTATVQQRRVSVSEVCAALASYSNQNAFPPGQVADLDTAIIAVCDDPYPGHSEHFFPQFSIRCNSCQATGQVSVPLFDAMLIVNADNNTIDLSMMLTSRNPPRLALDRDDVGFSHAIECLDHDQLSQSEIAGCLIFALKITSPMSQLPMATQVIHLLNQQYNVPSLGQDPVVHPFLLTGILVVQGGPPHHFLVTERFHQRRVLVYDNLQGHKWIPVDQIQNKSLAWGLIFRPQNQQSYSFQPEQYKVISPSVLTEADKSKGSKTSKTTKQPPPLGINAGKYNYAPSSKKYPPERPPDPACPPHGSRSKHVSSQASEGKKDSRIDSQGAFTLQVHTDNLMSNQRRRPTTGSSSTPPRQDNQCPAHVDTFHTHLPNALDHNSDHIEDDTSLEVPPAKRSSPQPPDIERSGPPQFKLTPKQLQRHRKPTSR